MAVSKTATVRFFDVKVMLNLKIFEKKLLGCRSRGEFVAEAVRDKLIQSQ
jgi:hypothetical protein